MVGPITDRVAKIERDIQALSAHERAELLAWFIEFDWMAWDHQLEQDVCAGALDVLAEQALRDRRFRN